MDVIIKNPCEPVMGHTHHVAESIVSVCGLDYN